MSTSNVPTSNFTRIFQGACDEYQRLTGHNLYTHPFSAEIQSCNSPESILNVLQQQAQTLNKCRKGNEKLLKFLNPIVNTLFVFSGTLGEGVGLVSLSFPFFIAVPKRLSLSHALPERQFFQGSVFFSAYVLPLFPGGRPLNSRLRR